MKSQRIYLFITKHSQNVPIAESSLTFSDKLFSGCTFIGLGDCSHGVSYFQVISLADKCYILQGIQALPDMYATSPQAFISGKALTSLMLKLLHVYQNQTSKREYIQVVSFNELDRPYRSKIHPY